MGVYQGTNHLPRGESIFVTWPPKIFHEVTVARLIARPEYPFGQF